MTSVRPRRRLPKNLRRLVRLLVLLLIGNYLVVPQLAGARKALSVIADLNPLLVVAGVISEIAALACYAQLTRSLLSGDDRPRFFTVFRVQFATLGASHVIPGGTAAATPIGYRLLRRAGVNASDAGFVLGVQGIASAAVLNVLLWFALVVSIPFRGANPAYLGVAAVGAVVIGGFSALVVAMSRGSKAADRFVAALARRFRFIDPDALGRFLQELIARFRRLATDRKVLFSAIGWAASNWALDALSLWIFLAAVGIHTSPDGLVIAFGLANVSAAIPLTPGGVGVYEAVMTSSLVGFAVPRAQAIIGVLTYRFFAFWLPIPLGAIAYLSAATAGEEPETAPAGEALESAYESTASQADDPRTWAERRGLRSRKPRP
ncbi:MAG: YbhN family protein [Acidimicrobiia bacterium]